MSSGPTNADLDAWIEKLMGCNYLSEKEVEQLCNKVRKKLSIFIASSKAS